LSAAADRRFVYMADTAMPTLWPVVFALLLSGATDPDPDRGRGARVRGLGSFVRSLIADTAARSATVRDLLARLTGSDVIVYVEMTGTPEIPTARTKLVTTAPGVRFLRIGISLTVPFNDLAPLLAHELQHAVEIAEHRDVTDDEGVRRLYDRIGRALGRDRFETDAAHDVERAVRAELRRRIGG
jgi:hypothetical protein